MQGNALVKSKSLWKISLAHPNNNNNFTFISWNIPWWDHFRCPTLWAQSKQTRIQHIMIFCHIKYDGIQFRYVAQVRIQLSSKSKIDKLFCLKKVCLELQFEESTISNCWPRLLFQTSLKLKTTFFFWSHSIVEGKFNFIEFFNWSNNLWSNFGFIMHSGCANASLGGSILRHPQIEVLNR